MTDYARVVVIGGGNMGASVLYHPAGQGWNDCVLIEKAQLTSGATWHAAGLVSRMVASFSLGSLHDYAVDLYKTIEAQTGVCVSWHGCGSLRVATSADHMDWINHLRDAILARGQTAEIISPEQVADLNPLYDVKAAGIVAALFTPDDGHVDPTGCCQAMRNIKRSGVYDKTAALGATFEEAGGWERPRVYGCEPLAWRRSSIHQQIASECRSVRKRVGLGDFSAFAKFEITGSEPELFLNRICTNRMPAKVGGICLTLLLNETGSIEGEATIARLAENKFYLVTGAPSQRRVWDWLSLHQRGDERVEMLDRTDELGILTLAGPKARDVMSALTDVDVSNRNFPWITALDITVSGVAVTALRLSFTGELAFELHAANNRLGALWEALWQAGKCHDIGVFGSKAIDSLRMEKCYRGGHELTNDVTPKQTGMMRFVKLDKDFVGKTALENQRPGSQCVLLALEHTSTECLMCEAVFVDGKLAGSITSVVYGHTLEKSLAIGFVKPALLNQDSTIEVSLFGERLKATHLKTIPYDPQNLRPNS